MRTLFGRFRPGCAAPRFFFATVAVQHTQSNRFYKSLRMVEKVTTTCLKGGLPDADLSLVMAEDNHLLTLLFPGIDWRQEPFARGLFEGYG
jgi:hypothetical protein